MHILVLVPDTPQGLSLVRWAAQLARLNGGSFWCAHSASTPAHLRLHRAPYLDAALRLAGDLGGRSIDVDADIPHDEMVRFAAQHHITHILVGKPRDVPLAQFLAAALPDSVISEDGYPHVVIVTEPAQTPHSP